MEKTRSGFKTEVYTTTQAIPEEKNRSARFWDYVEYMTPDGRTVTAKLNIASTLHPAFTVGTKVRVSFDKADPDIALAIFDIRTWVIGIFIFMVGFCYAVPALFFAIFAHKPIEIPEDTPDEDPTLSQKTGIGGPPATA